VRTAKITSYSGQVGGLLALYPLDLLSEDAHGAPALRENAFSGVTLAINVASPEEVDDALKTARQDSARIVKEPVGASWGGRSGYFTDLENNHWEVAWAPEMSEAEVPRADREGRGDGCRVE